MFLSNLTKLCFYEIIISLLTIGKEFTVLNKEWSSLNIEPKSKKMKRGHLAEYYTEMQLILYGFETYKTTVDDTRAKVAGLVARRKMVSRR
jgi:hypothetical protein